MGHVCARARRRVGVSEDAEAESALDQRIPRRQQVHFREEREHLRDPVRRLGLQPDLVLGGVLRRTAVGGRTRRRMRDASGDAQMRLTTHVALTAEQPALCTASRGGGCGTRAPRPASEEGEACGEEDEE